MTWHAHGVRRRRASRRLPGPLKRFHTPDALTVAAFSVWSVTPILFLLVKARGHDRVWGGAWAALTPADQYRYLAWIQDAGQHLLISNKFGPEPADHVYLHPMFLLSGLGWRLGIDLRLAYLLWLPVCLGVLVWGFKAYVACNVEGGWARRSPLIIALFYFTPLLPVVDYGRVFNRDQNWFSAIAAGELAPYWQAWGYLPTIAALGLMAVYLLGLGAILDPARQRGPQRTGSYAAWPAAAGAGAAWLHPWAGLTLLLITGGLVAWDRLARRNLVLIFPALATIAPLAYYWVLSLVSTEAWGLGQLRISWERPLWATAFAIAPLLPLAALGLRTRRWSVQRRALVLWPFAAVCAYFLMGSDGHPALEGITLPLAILSVQGWQSLRLPSAAAGALVFLSVLPGMAYSAHTSFDYIQVDQVPYLLKTDDLTAVRQAGSPPPGGSVIASPNLGTVVPAYSGRSTWVAFSGLNAVFTRRAPKVESLLEGRLTRAQARALVSVSGARYVVADCRHRAALSSDLAPTWLARFGCATVYRIPGTRAHRAPRDEP
jgi:hypothetical protein